MIGKEMIKELRPMKANELEMGGIFYLQGADGTFSTCQIEKWELKNKSRATYLRKMTSQYSKDGKLFIRIQKPFESFA